MNSHFIHDNYPWILGPSHGRGNAWSMVFERMNRSSKIRLVGRRTKPSHSSVPFVIDIVNNSIHGIWDNIRTRRSRHCISIRWDLVSRATSCTWRHLWLRLMRWNRIIQSSTKIPNFFFSFFFPLTCLTDRSAPFLFIIIIF